MGIFDKLFDTTPQLGLMNDQEAMMALIYSALSIDGIVDDMEIDNLAAILARRKLFHGMVVEDTYGKVATLHGTMGGQALVRAAAQRLSENYKVSAFALITDLMLTNLILTNGSIGIQEKSMLEHLQQELGLGDEVVTKIVEVMLLKNNF